MAYRRGRVPAKEKDTVLSRFRALVGNRQDGNAGSPSARGKTAGEPAERVNKLRRRLRKKDQEIAELRERLAAFEDRAGDATSGFEPENVVWIFCTGRSGSTWLASIMEETENHGMWNEPLVGQLFGEFYYVRASHKRGGKGILGERYRDVWLRSIRSMVLEGAAARYSELAGSGGRLVIKEPHGSVGAPLLSAALPESRLVLLVRDPRDVVASALDGQKRGSWASATLARKQGRENRETLADTDPDAFVRGRANVYLRDITRAGEAYHAHRGPKSLVRYEDLKADTLGSVRRIYAELGLPADEEDLARAVEKHAWENVPEQNKGEGKFYRKASPGGWREDLTPQQARIVEKVAAPLLAEYYA